MEKYIVVIEKAENNYSAFSPDLPGCITVGTTIDEVISFMREAIELYLEELIEENEAIPHSKSLADHIQEGIFDDDQIGEEYYIAKIEVHTPKVAA